MSIKPSTAQMLASSAQFLKNNADENFYAKWRTSYCIRYEMVRRSVLNFDSIRAYLVFKPDLLDGEDADYVDADSHFGSTTKEAGACWRLPITVRMFCRILLSESILSDDSNSERFIVYFCLQNGLYQYSTSEKQVVVVKHYLRLQSCTIFSRW